MCGVFLQRSDRGVLELRCMHVMQGGFSSRDLHERYSHTLATGLIWRLYRVVGVRRKLGAL